MAKRHQGRELVDDAELSVIMATAIDVRANTERAVNSQVEPEPGESHHHHYQAVLERVVISNAAS